MREFLMADLNTRGELQFQQLYSYALLEQVPGAVDLIARFSSAIWREPQGDEVMVPCDDGAIGRRWLACAPTAGIASVRCGNDLSSLTLLASGIDTDSDLSTLKAYQSHLLHQLRDTEIEPAFALLELKSRPLAATINFRSPQSPQHRQIVALADQCFAAAYFRFHQLA